MSTPNWDEQADEIASLVFRNTLPSNLAALAKAALVDRIAAALAAAYQQGREDERTAPDPKVVALNESIMRDINARLAPAGTEKDHPNG